MNSNPNSINAGTTVGFGFAHFRALDVGSSRLTRRFGGFFLLDSRTLIIISIASALRLPTSMLSMRIIPTEALLKFAQLLCSTNATARKNNCISMSKLDSKMNKNLKAC